MNDFRKVLRLLFFAALIANFVSVQPTFGANIAVETNADELDGSPGNGQCSLREAVANANNDNDDQADCTGGTGADTIMLPSATYILNLYPADANSNELDVTDGDGLTIIGAGARDTTIDANDNSRVFNVLGGGILTLEHLKVQGGQADYGTSGGGGIQVSDTDSYLTLEQVSVTGNEAAIYGGGIYIIDVGIGGGARIFRSTISGNTCPGTNSLNGDGGGIRSDGSGIVSIINSTISGNTANNNGGGIQVVTFSDIDIRFSTITGNSAGSDQSDVGSNINAGLNGDVTISNSIVSNPLGNGANCGVFSGSITSQDYNIDDGTACGFAETNDQSDTNPQINVLAGNGGETDTHALLETSPAVDQIADGTNGCGTDPDGSVDQRGITRPLGGECDIGAFELELQLTLMVNIEGAASGRVEAPPDENGDGIDCPGDCTGTYTAGAHVTLTPFPVGNSLFDDWVNPTCPVVSVLVQKNGIQSDARQAPADSEITLYMEDDCEITALFEPAYIPTLSQWGLIGLALLIFATGAFVIRRRKTT